MTEIADRYARLSDAFDDTLKGVKPESWDAPTPCPDWTARQLVEHVANNAGLFFGLINEPKPELPPASDDPAAAWRASDAATRKALGDPNLADRPFDGFFGPTTFAKSVDAFMSFDLAVHRWDLARATGQAGHIPDDEIGRLFDTAKGFGSAMRQQGAFGPELKPPADADEETRLLAFLGRRA